MPRIFWLLTALVLLFALAGCASKGAKPDLPPSTPITPEIVIVERKVYVAIPASLTQEQPIAEGSIAQCFHVAAQRRAALVKANARLREIGAIQGTAVKP